MLLSTEIRMSLVSFSLQYLTISFHPGVVRTSVTEIKQQHRFIVKASGVTLGNLSNMQPEVPTAEHTLYTLNKAS